MSKKWIIGLIVTGSIFVIGLLITISVISWGTGVFNKEVMLRNQITAKQVDNKNQFDSMWKSQMQAFEITDVQKQMLYDIIVGHAKARSGHGSLATMVTESIPNLNESSSMYKQLLNTVVGLRASWTSKQTEILDYKRTHDNIVDMFPSSIICSMFNKQKIEVKIVTSDRTEASFDSGKDNDINLKPTK